MRFARPLSASLLALALAASAGFAEPVAFKIDPSHSQVGFNVRHFFTKVPGQFNDFSGRILYDEKNVAASSVEVEIKTASVDTNNERRDNHLRSPDFFAADSFSAITFKSTKVTPAANNRLKVDGNLTIRGVTRPVTLDAAFLGMGPGGQGGAIAGWEATTTINRKDYGVLWNRTLDHGGAMLGDDVNITIAIEARKEMPAAAKPAAEQKAENK